LFFFNVPLPQARQKTITDTEKEMTEKADSISQKP